MDENYCTHHEVSPAKETHAHGEAVKTEQASKHVQEVQQKTRKIISRFVSALSLSSQRLISLYLAKVVDSVHILFLSSRRLQTCVVEKKNFCISEPRWCFVCSSLFLTARSDWNLRRSTARIDPLEPWWCKRLFGVVVLQKSI